MSRQIVFAIVVEELPLLESTDCVNLKGDNDRRGTHKSTDCVNEQ